MSDTNDNDQFKVDMIVPTAGVSDDEVLDTVRSTRLGILDIQLARGMPTDNDGWSQLHQNLQELEKGAFAKKRLAQDDKSVGAQIAIAEHLAESLYKHMGGNNAYATGGGVIPNPIKDIEGSATLVEGELKLGDDTSTYEEFQATHGRALDEARKAQAPVTDDDET